MSVRVGIDFVITWFLSVFLVRRLIFAGLAVSAYGTLVQYVRVAECVEARLADLDDREKLPQMVSDRLFPAVEGTRADSIGLIRFDRL